MRILKAVVVIFIVCFVILAVFAMIIDRQDRIANASNPAGISGANAPAAATSQKLNLIQYNGSLGDSGYSEVNGLVRNPGPLPLKNVAAVVTWFDQNGVFITSDTTLIEYNPILPGQTSPFRVLTRKNPAMSKFAVEFKDLLGGSIPHEQAPAGSPAQDSAEVSASEYNFLWQGMQYDEVVRYLGFHGQEVSRVNAGDVTSVMYVWANPDGSNMRATFKNGALESKTQSDLR